MGRDLSQSGAAERREARPTLFKSLSRASNSSQTHASSHGFVDGTASTRLSARAVHPDA